MLLAEKSFLLVPSTTWFFRTHSQLLRWDTFKEFIVCLVVANCPLVTQNLVLAKLCVSWGCLCQSFLFVQCLDQVSSLGFAEECVTHLSPWWPLCHHHYLLLVFCNLSLHSVLNCFSFCSVVRCFASSECCFYPGQRNLHSMISCFFDHLWFSAPSCCSATCWLVTVHSLAAAL